MTRRTGLVIAAALALAPFLGAASPAVAPPPPPHGGTIAIQPGTADGEYDPSLHVFVEAASKTLTGKGFTVFDDPAHAAYWGELVLSRAGVGTGFAKDPNAAKVGVGAGLVVPMSTGRSNVVTLERTRLELRIRKRDGDVVWRGTAVTVRPTGTPKGTDDAVATDLSNALLQGYPAEPEDVVGVP
jgi:hypothetical protein